MTNTHSLTQVALGVILLSIQTTIAPNAFAQANSRTTNRTLRTQPTQVEVHSPSGQQPATNDTFAAPGTYSGIECQQLGSGAYLCGCGTTDSGECHDTFRAECGHVEPGQALCDEAISDE